MNCRVRALLLCTAVSIPALFGATQVGTITASGSFKLREAHIPSTAVRSLPLVSGDEVDTISSTALILLRDTSRVILDRNSKIKLERTGEDTLLHLQQGELRFKTLPGAHLVILANGKLMRPNAPSEGVVSAANTGSLPLFMKTVAAQVAAGQVGAAPMLRIMILEGEGAINNVRLRVAREPIIEVQDENNRPVSGASVVFLLPRSGPSGVFSNGTRSLTVVTDSQGRAVGTGLTPNKTVGKFQITVNASYQGQMATAVITQVNVLAAVAGAAAGSSVLIPVIAGTSAAAIGGTVAAVALSGDAPPLSSSLPQQ